MIGLEDRRKLAQSIEAARLAETIIGRPLAGRIMHAGSLRQYRNKARVAA